MLKGILEWSEALPPEIKAVLGVLSFVAFVWFIGVVTDFGNFQQGRLEKINREERESDG